MAYNKFNKVKDLNVIQVGYKYPIRNVYNGITDGRPWQMLSVGSEKFTGPVVFADNMGIDFEIGDWFMIKSIKSCKMKFNTYTNKNQFHANCIVEKTTPPTYAKKNQTKDETAVEDLFNKDVDLSWV